MARLPRVVTVLERIARKPTAPTHEHAVLEEATRLARGFGASVRADSWGNLVVAPPRLGRGPPVWLVAHTDHPGFEMVGPGEARFLGGVGRAYFRRGLRLRFYHDGEAVPARLARYSPRTGRLALQSTSEVRRLRRRDMGVFELEDFRLERGLVHACQLDDLAGSAVALAVLERACRSAMPVRALLTRAEEIGFVGTLGAAQDGRIPRGAWVINVEASKAIPGVEIGRGPVIRVGDRRKTFDPHAESLLLAARARLPRSKPVQRWLMSGGTCEATPWGLYGWKSTGVAIPLGNYHNQGPRNRVAAEIVSAQDLSTAVDLIELAARDARAGVLWDDRTRRQLEGYLRTYGGRLRER